MINEHDTVELDLRDVEAELCRLPDIAAVRIVSDEIGRPIEVHVLADTHKHPKQVVRDIQSVALASFGLEFDRRIVSVVQLGPNGTSAAAAAAPTVIHDDMRTVVATIQATMADLRTTIQVTLSNAGQDATGFAEGSASSATRPRLVAVATLDALRQLMPQVGGFDVDAARVERIGENDVVVVTLTCLEPPLEHSLSGSAIVRRGVDDAGVRAVLDSTNRRLPFLGRALHNA